MRKKPRHIIEILPLIIIMLFVKMLPKQIALQCGKIIGYAIYILGIRKKVIQNNIRMIFNNIPSKAQQSIIKKTYINILVFIVEFLNTSPIDRKKFIIKGEENLYEAQKHGKGTLIVLGHLGNWEIMARLLATYPFKCNVVARHMKNPIADKIIEKNRNKFNLNVIYQKNAVSKIIRELKRNSFTGILVDQDAGKKGIFPTFLGHTASTVPTVAGLSIKYNCRVLPVFLLKKNGQYILDIGKHINIANTGNKDDDILNGTQTINNIIGEKILEYPEQYFGWFHKRWKTKPPC